MNAYNPVLRPISPPFCLADLGGLRGVRPRQEQVCRGGRDSTRARQYRGAGILVTVGVRWEVLGMAVLS